MRKKTSREARESSLVGGWTVEGEGPPPAASEAGRVHSDEAAGGESDGPHASDAHASASGGSDPDAADLDAQGARASDPDAPGVEASPQQMSTVALVLLGVFGGLYLLYTWVWFTWADFYADLNRATAAGSGSIGSVLQQIVYWAAPLAPALWFLTAVLVSRPARTGRLAVLLLIGAVVLVPVPMFLEGFSL